MELRAAGSSEIGLLAGLVIGDASQASTVAGMRLFGLERLEDALELNRVMIASTESWRSTTVADVDGVTGMVQVGEASMAFTPDVVELARRFYGDDFQTVLGPRLVAQARVQTSYPSGCQRVSEIHVAPRRRGEGIGSALMSQVAEIAQDEGFTSLGLHTLTTNPARRVFEAWGFEIADTVTDPGFEELTGASGYHLMLRAL